MEPEDLSFEIAYQQLEELVVRLEGGQLSVEDLVSHFERGMALVRLCRERLDNAQARVTVLTRELEIDPRGLFDVDGEGISDPP